MVNIKDWDDLQKQLAEIKQLKIDNNDLRLKLSEEIRQKERYYRDQQQAEQKTAEALRHATSAMAYLDEVTWLRKQIESLTSLTSNISSTSSTIAYEMQMARTEMQRNRDTTFVAPTKNHVFDGVVRERCHCGQYHH